MESTTLITFMLQHSTASFVELWGSWDNFAAPWDMKQDSRRGRGHWTGCHKFRNIICDGDSGGFHEKRDGGLMMGGTYWYYYRINGEEEHFDSSQPWTSSSPLLPGQYVNVLEVPWEKKFVSRSGSSSVAMITAVHTLNPDDRYRNPRPAPKPRLPKLMTKLDPATIRAWSAAPPETPGSATDHRQVKSATNTATNVFAAAIDRVQTPVSPHFQTIGHRINPVRLGSSEAQLRFLDLPLVKVTAPGQFLDKSQISYPKPLSAPAIAPKDESISLPKRKDPFSKTVRLLQEGQNLGTMLENLPQSLNHRRAVTAGDIRPVTQIIHRRTMSDSEQTFVHSSPVISKPSRHTIVRKPVARQANFLFNVDISSSNGETGTPACKTTASSNVSQISKVEDPSWSSKDVPTESDMVNLDKDLPALPSYLVPSPLFSRKILADPRAAKPSPFVVDWTSKQSRFSIWTALSEEAEAEAEDADADNESDTDFQDGVSSSFSDIQDSGYPSPLNFSSDPFWTSTSEKMLNRSQKQDPQTLFSAPATNHYRLDSPEQNSLGGCDSLTMKNMTAMEQLLEEFEYIGSALI